MRLFRHRAHLFRLLHGIYVQLRFVNRRITKLMSTTDDLTAAVAAIQTAVGDASGAIKDLAAKLGAASSVNPADVEAAANKLTAIAAGLESAVAAAGEPTTPAPAPVPPASAVADGASPNPPGSTTAGDTSAAPAS